MKRFTVFFALFLIFASLQAQKKNTIFIATQPGDLGIGIRYDRIISANIGLYGTATRGNYKLANNAFINDHCRYSIGYTVLLPQKMHDNTQSRFTCGLVYHKYGIRQFNVMDVNYERAFSPASVECGVAGRIDRLNMAIRMDIFKWEGCVDFGFSF